MRLIDTNIVIYAAGKAHPLQEGKREKCLTGLLREPYMRT